MSQSGGSRGKSIPSCLTSFGLALGFKGVTGVFSLLGLIGTIQWLLVFDSLFVYSLYFSPAVLLLVSAILISLK